MVRLEKYCEIALQNDCSGTYSQAALRGPSRLGKQDLQRRFVIQEMRRQLAIITSDLSHVVLTKS